MSSIIEVHESVLNKFRRIFGKLLLKILRVSGELLEEDFLRLKAFFGIGYVFLRMYVRISEELMTMFLKTSREVLQNSRDFVGQFQPNFKGCGTTLEDFFLSFGIVMAFFNEALDLLTGILLTGELCELERLRMFF